MTDEALPPMPPHAHYAGFWLRFIAACIDLVLYMPVYWGMGIAFDYACLHVLGVSMTDASVDYADVTPSTPHEVYRWWFESIFGVVALLSYSWFFSSKWQASPGMHLLKFRVTGEEGQRIGFLRALAWGITGTFGWLICCAGVLYLQKDIMIVRDMLDSCKEQNVDMADCVTEVEKAIGISFISFQHLMYAAAGLTVFMFLIWALSIALPRDKTGFHNLICGTRFLKGRP